jgi:hypothetical protein
MYPLDHCDDGDVLDGGYAFMQWTGSVWHPGDDNNAGDGGDADLGLPIRACEPGLVEFVQQWDGRTIGEGTHVWVRGLWSGKHVHHNHLEKLGPAVGLDTRVERGTVLGYCGKSGGWRWAHDHFEVCREKPRSWWQWPKGWSRADVAAAYQAPAIYVREMDQRAAAEWNTQEDFVITPEMMSDAQIVEYLEQLGHPVMFGMRERAILAYRREENPGPAMTGEYPAVTVVDGVEIQVSRQKFTNTIFEYRPDKNAVDRCEVVLHPELITA